MEKEVKRVWVVTTNNTRVDENGVTINNGNNTTSCFSSEEKAKVHIEWLRGCAKNNGCFKVWDDGMSGCYRLPNNDRFNFTTNRYLLDADDLIMGNA